MLANYPVQCPSLAGYILLTSGTTAGICDDQGPAHHPLTGPNIFAQLDRARLRKKFAGLASYVISAEAQTKLLETVDRLEQVQDAAALTDLLVAREPVAA